MAFDRADSGAAGGAAGQWAIGMALTLLVSSGILYADFMNVIILGMHEKLGLSLQLAGDISSLDLFGTAIGSLIGALFARRLAGLRMAAAYTAAIVALDVGAVFADQWQPLALLRGLHGLACGGLLAFCGAALAQRARPERVMGAALALQLALASLGAQLLPPVVRGSGPGAVFAIMAAVELMALALLLANRRAFAAILARAPAPVPAGAARARARMPRRAVALCGAAMGALCLFQCARFMVVGYGFQIGDFFALKRPFVGAVIGVGNWMSGAGAIVATLLPQRLGRAIPLLAAAAGTFAAALALIGLGADPAMFAVATGMSALLMFVALPYHYGVCFAVDEGGAMGIWTAFVSKLGLSLGPACGAFLLARHALPVVLGISALLVLAATLLASWPGRVIDARGLPAA